MLTHTSPGPPRGAGVATNPVAAVPAAAEGEALTGRLGLKKSPSVFFAGDGDGVTAREAAAGFSLRARFALGEAEGDSVPEGEVPSSAGEAVAAAFLCVRCFAGEGDAAGDSFGVGD